jgi:hypothetical protein
LGRSIAVAAHYEVGEARRRPKEWLDRDAVVDAGFYLVLEKMARPVAAPIDLKWPILRPSHVYAYGSRRSGGRAAPRFGNQSGRHEGAALRVTQRYKSGCWIQVEYSRSGVELPMSRSILTYLPNIGGRQPWVDIN